VSIRRWFKCQLSEYSQQQKPVIHIEVQSVVVSNLLTHDYRVTSWKE